MTRGEQPLIGNGCDYDIFLDKILCALHTGFADLGQLQEFSVGTRMTQTIATYYIIYSLSEFAVPALKWAFIQIQKNLTWKYKENSLEHKQW